MAVAILLSVTSIVSGDYVAKSAANMYAGLVAQASTNYGAQVEHYYHVEAYRDGKLLWEEKYPNLVTTEGKNAYLNCSLKAGACTAGVSATAVGLVTGPSETGFAAGDTMASHAGWGEDTTYDEYAAGRPAYTTGTISAGSVDNSASKATFTISGTVTISGTFLCGGSTNCVSHAATTNTVLYGAGAFTGGDRALVDNDVLYVTITASIS